MDPNPQSLTETLASFQSLRRRLESSVVAGATSVDGRTFSYQAPVGSDVVSPGGFVTLVDGDRRAVRLQLTAAGEAALRRAEATMAENLQPLLDRCEDAAVVDTALAQLGGALDAAVADRVAAR